MYEYNLDQLQLKNNETSFSMIYYVNNDNN
jgi:hypothetical protein